MLFGFDSFWSYEDLTYLTPYIAINVPEILATCILCLETMTDSVTTHVYLYKISCFIFITLEIWLSWPHVFVKFDVEIAEIPYQSEQDPYPVNDHIGRNQNAKREKNSYCSKYSDYHSEGYPHYRELFQNDETVNEVPERILNCHRPLKPCGRIERKRIVSGIPIARVPRRILRSSFQSLKFNIHLNIVVS